MVRPAGHRITPDHLDLDHPASAIGLGKIPGALGFSASDRMNFRMAGYGSPERGTLLKDCSLTKTT
jgi:hypothetical protein